MRRGQGCEDCVHDHPVHVESTGADEFDEGIHHVLRVAVHRVDQRLFVFGWKLGHMATDRCPEGHAEDREPGTQVVSVAFRAPVGGHVPQLPPEHEEALVDAVDRDAQYVVDALVELVRSGALNVYWVIVNAVFTSLSAPHVRSVLDRRDLLARFEVGPPSARTALLDAVAEIVLAEPGYRGPRDARGLMDAIHTELHDRRHRDVDYACDIYAGFVGRWLEERLLSRDEMSWDRERRRR